MENKKHLWTVFLAAVAIALAFALYTNHAWEDFMITYRTSKNLATGNGMVFTIGERVHVFTSPLNTLLPALGAWVTGSDAAALWFFRLVSIAGLGGAAALLYRLAMARGFGTVATLTTVGLVMLDSKIVDFSINGQETGLMTFFAALALHAIFAFPRRPVLQLALGWAGLLWTRPDACVYIAAAAIGALLFDAGSGAARTRSELLKTFAKAGTLATALYVPWLVFATVYFGSPIPNTVIAKGLRHHRELGDVLKSIPSYLWEVATGSAWVLRLLFEPTNTFLGGWPDGFTAFAHLCGWIAAVYWVLPVGSPLARAASFSLLLGGWYLQCIAPGIFAWYLPNIQIFAIITLGAIFHDVSSVCERMTAETNLAAAGIRGRRTVLGVAFALAAAFATTLAASARQLEVQQRLIESGNRTAIGNWLKEHARSPADTVFAECLGYLGYYSQLKMLDYPGLSSLEVIAARRELGTDDYGRLIDKLRPTWLVLRPFEVHNVKLSVPQLLDEHYRLVEIFDVSGAINQISWLPGRGYLQFDQNFMIFARND